MAAGEFIPNNGGGKDCDDYPTWGQKSARYDYIYKGQSDEDNYPEEACDPWIHGNAQIDNLQVNNSIVGGGEIDITGEIKTASEVTATEVRAGAITLTSRKPFDIPHPTKSGYRLRHVCLEGPEAGVYYRGRLTDSNTIDLPEYWIGLVDPESITVILTQIGSSQDLIVDKIEWGRKVIIKSGNASNINCYFLIHGERKDGEKLIVEYEGSSIDDYPGDNSIYSINK